MSEPFIGLLIESLVAVLLVLTIGYCLVLNHRLKRLRADESSLRATIGELVDATQIAQRAIDGLKVTVKECDMTLGERLRTAERMAAELGREVQRGEEIVARIQRIAAAANGQQRTKPEAPAAQQAAPPPAAERRNGRVADAVAAAQALASRTRERVAGRAA